MPNFSAHAIFLSSAALLAACSSHNATDDAGRASAMDVAAVESGADVTNDADDAANDAVDAIVPGDAIASDGGTDAHDTDASTRRTSHYTVNIGGAIGAVQSLGFDLVDIAGSTNNPAGIRSVVDALPAGMRAIVWVGNLGKPGHCDTPGFSTAQFQAQVDALASDTRVFGYLLADEPHPSGCPTAVDDIRGRADYIRAHAPAQMSFIVVLDGTNACGGTLGCEYSALGPSHTHVDFFGIDVYPCHYDTSGVAVPCDDSAIGTRATAAIANGIPVEQIVPVYQAFGQQGRSDGTAPYYRMPSVAELQSMLAAWRSVVPSPVFDYAYTYGVQCSASSCVSSQAIANHPEIQPVVQAHNAQ